MTWQAVLILGVPWSGLCAAAGWWARGAHRRNHLNVRTEPIAPDSSAVGYRVWLGDDPIGPLSSSEKVGADLARIGGAL